MLALGIGLNTAIFSVVYAMLFKPYAVESPHELVSIYSRLPKQPDRPTVISSAFYRSLRDDDESFTELTAQWGVTYTMRAAGQTDMIAAAWVLSNYFDVLGVKPALGRPLLGAEDDISTTERAAVISHALWTRRFGADPGILGRQITLALYEQTDVPFTIVGVMPPGFTGITDPWKPAQLWVTMAQGRLDATRSRDQWSAVAVARLRPGVTLEQTRVRLEARARQFQSAQRGWKPEYEWRPALYRTNDIRTPYDPAAAVIPARMAGALTLVVSMVLLVAAANIAGILMARGVGRSGEIAVRRVLGAGPVRIVRQLLAESLLLAAGGGVLGFLAAAWLLEAFRLLTPLQFAFDVSMDTRIALFTVAICVAAGLVVGIMPAWQAMKLDVLPWLAGGSGMQTRPSSRRLRHGITMPQVAGSLVLLLVAGVYVRDLLRVELTDTGYTTRNVVVAYPVLRTHPGERADPRQRDPAAGRQREERYAERTRRFYAQLVDRLRTVPGAADVAIAGWRLPLYEQRGDATWHAVPHDDFQAGVRQGVESNSFSISPGYFRTLDIPLLAGRDFDARDTPRMPKVAIVSAGVAQRLWPGRDPLGRMVTLVSAWSPSHDSTSYEVIGVARDVRPVLHESGAHHLVYLPLSQEWRPSVSLVLARGVGDSRTLIPAVQEAVRGADTFADVTRVRTLSEITAEILYPRRLAAAVLGVSAALALFLATIGIYGVVSYSVAQRTGEIGVRLALGAERSDIVRLVLREGMTIATAGALAGIGAGYAAIRITSSRYLSLPSVDPVTLTVTPLLIGAIVLLACYVPARRAGRVDPMEVLRRT